MRIPRHEFRAGPRGGVDTLLDEEEGRRLASAAGRLLDRGTRGLCLRSLFGGFESVLTGPSRMAAASEGGNVERDVRVSRVADGLLAASGFSVGGSRRLEAEEGWAGLTDAEKDEACESARLLVVAMEEFSEKTIP